MTLSFSLQKLEGNSGNLHQLNIQNFCQLQAEQLTSHYPILCIRIVYYNSLLKTHQEVISYNKDQLIFPPKKLAYLRSESWMKTLPHTLELEEFELPDLPEFISYVCPIGYKNQKPEYIQIIAHESLSLNLQKYVINAAILLNRYADICQENERQKLEIKLLENVLQKIGHQVRNSLSLIGLYAHNLYLGLEEICWQEQAKIICKSIEDLDTNLTDLISCGQSANLSIAPQDLRSLVVETIKYLQPLIAQKNLTISIPETSTMLLLDRLQMKQVFDNIISNAIQYSPSLATINCNWQIFNEEVLIKISDQGAGISQEDIPKIFNPFYSRRQGGTGLGLTIAKKIVLDHHGHLWAQNLPGGGAVFSIILPRK
ncbi:sensor histidine kinase [Anabaena subtropica]|uniref:histidine kinase n=1 Tax=Anabaena subtropica FACHB-260 TaxID=2692884 RepID=A0ABR8CPS2_9NOST|nr:ATP-binding protein [Anabaena subtropica]MBD2343800.1 sensor histidine kinase [Anabaena subtropica FACHB-260]